MSLAELLLVHFTAPTIHAGFEGTIASSRGPADAIGGLWGANRAREISVKQQ
jgi:hypothetical protein